MDFFVVFSDFTSVYCEILYICILFSSLWSLRTSQWVLTSGEKREGSLFHIWYYSFVLKQLAIYYFIHVTLYIWFGIDVQFLDLFLWVGFPNITFKSSIYFEILSNPWISWIFLRISSLYTVKSLDLLGFVLS